MPMGVIIFVDCFVLPRLGLEGEYYERMRRAGRTGLSNWPAIAAWAVATAAVLPPVLAGYLAVFFAPLPGAPLTALVYTLGTVWRDRDGSQGQASGEGYNSMPEDSATDSAPSTRGPSLEAFPSTS